MSVVARHEMEYKENVAKITELYKESPEQMRKRQEVNAKNMERIKAKLARQEYDKIVAPASDGKYAGIKGMTKEMKQFSSQSAEEKNELRFVLTYGFGFITMMFLGFFSGYVLGKYGMRMSEENSLILSLAIGIATIFLEALLMIWRIHKMELMREEQSKTDKNQIDLLQNIQKIAENRPDSLMYQLK